LWCGIQEIRSNVVRVRGGLFEIRPAVDLTQLIRDNEAAAVRSDEIVNAG